MFEKSTVIEEESWLGRRRVEVMGRVVVESLFYCMRNSAMEVRL
jgi:hypothetical protein